MTIESKDYLELSRARYTQQFKNRGNVDSLVKTWLDGTEAIQKTQSAIDDIKYIDRVHGTNLDNIGDIVGQPRTLVDASLLPYFGFGGDPSSHSYGSLTDPTVGGRWRSLKDNQDGGNIELADDLYRMFIRAKIVRNRTIATPEDVIDSIKFVLQADWVQLHEGPAPATISISIGKNLSETEKNFIRYSYKDGVNRTLFVKPAGVRLDYYKVYSPENAFAFQGFPNAKGFGDIRDIAYYSTTEDGTVVPDFHDPLITEVSIGGKYAGIVN